MRLFRCRNCGHRMRGSSPECGQCGRAKALYQTSGFVTGTIVLLGLSVSAAMVLAAMQAR